MNAENDDLETRLELQLGCELRAQLDRQLGRAAPYFLARCAKANRRRGRRRSVLGVAAVAAACCAALITWRQMRPPAAPVLLEKKNVVLAEHDRAPPAQVNHAARSEPSRIERSPTTTSPGDDSEEPSMVGGAAAGQPLVLGRALTSRTFDEGTLLVGNTPVRKIRRQWMERVEWFDSRNRARVQRIVPREEVLFVPLPIN